MRKEEPTSRWSKNEFLFLAIPEEKKKDCQTEEYKGLGWCIL